MRQRPSVSGCKNKGEKMKAIDVIKAPPKNNWEAHKRWRNRLACDLAQMNRYRIRIPVK